MAYTAWYHNKIQFGRESVAGSAVAATVIWRGALGGLSDDRTIEMVDENIGVLVTAERSYTSALMAHCNLPSTPATFEQLPHIFEAGINTDAAPTGPGGDSEYTYEYAMATDNTINTVKTYTIEQVSVGAANDYREMEYGLVEEFNLSGSFGEPINVTSTWFGRQLSTGTATSLSTLQTVEEMLMNKASLYIDATGGTVGTTQQTGVFVGFDMNVRTGLIPVPVADGNLYFAAHKFVRPEITFSLTLELEGTADTVATERAIFESQAVRLFKIAIAGNAANFTSAYIQWAGKYDNVNPYENRDGNTVVTLDGHGVYSSTDSLFWEANVTNLLSSLP